MDRGRENNPAPQERPVSPSSASASEQEEEEADRGSDGGRDECEARHGVEEDDAVDNGVHSEDNGGESIQNNQQRNQSDLSSQYYPQQPPMDPNQQPPPGMLYPINMHLPYFPTVDQPPMLYDKTSPFQQPLPFPNFLGIPAPSIQHMNQSNNLDATRQYYEMQMREHAMQYANAAAGAAWAAARMAVDPMNLGYRVNMGEGNGVDSQYVAANRVGLQAAWLENDAGRGNGAQAAAAGASGQRQQRQLWKPPNAKSKAKSESPDYSAASSEKEAETPETSHRKTSDNHKSSNEKKRSKKRESGGNDSVSSLGSGSRDHSIGNSRKDNTENRKDGKQQQRQSRHNNQRQKRGLYQSYSPRGSSSSLGTMGSNPNSSTQHHTGRHKRRNTQSISSPRHGASGGSHVFLGGLIGKSGVSALHELCSKYRWEMPKYEVIEPKEKKEESAAQEGSSKNNSHNQDFILSVRVNGVELGRGKGGTKGSSKQDASRKALAALVPGVVFDPNGILLDVGSGLLRMIDENSRSTTTSLEELAPHLASWKLSTDQAVAGQRTRPSSPDNSEDSSISTAVSMTKSKSDGAGVILGGLLQSASSAVPGIYPSASSTSEVDDDDENAYYASGGARVCSSLLSAMWQIDYRIPEPPSYVFDLLLQQNNCTGGNSLPTDKKAEFIVPPVAEVTAHRLPFQCTASLKLYLPRRLVNGKDSSSWMDCWESPLEHLQSKPSAQSPQRQGEASREPSRKRKDSFASALTPSPIRQSRQRDGDSEEVTPSTSAPEQDEIVTHQIESIATGSTKRESKHRASASLLSMLFPECQTLVEVKAAAECARECYAAKKMIAQTKRAKLSNEHKSFSPIEASSLPKPLDKSESKEESKQPTSDQVAANESAASETEGLGEGFVSVAGLSLSEANNDCKRINGSERADDLDSKEALDIEVTTALHLFQDTRIAGQAIAGSLLLRRANSHDFDSICALLNKSPNRTPNAPKSTGTDPTYKESVNSPNDEISSDIVFSPDKRDKIILILLLSRVVVPQDEPPLGLSILSLSGHNEVKDRALTLHVIKHQDHLPRERFIECLEEFANLMDSHLDSSCTIHDTATPDIIAFVRQLSVEKPFDNYEEGGEHRLPGRQLQSVQEEDEDAGSEEDEGNDLAGRKRSRVD